MRKAGLGCGPDPHFLKLLDFTFFSAVVCKKTKMWLKPNSLKSQIHKTCAPRDFVSADHMIANIPSYINFTREKKSNRQYNLKIV